MGSLEGIGEANQEGMVDVFENHFFSLSMLNLVLLDNVVLVDRLHCKQLFGVFFLHEQHCSESAFTQHYFGCKVIDSDLLFEIVASVQSACGFPYHLSFLFLALQVLHVGFIIMHHELSFHLLWTVLLLLVFGSGKLLKVELLPVVERQLSPASQSICSQDKENNLVPSLC